MRAVACACLAAVLALGAAAVSAQEAVGGDVAPCCFTNPRYAGVCKVVPGEGDTCATILAYLNNQTSAGKTYCGSTTIRGGWTQVPCEGEQSASACTVHPTGQLDLAGTREAFELPARR